MAMIDAMIPRRPSRLFKSRWTALWWAAGVLFTAVTTVGFGPSASTNTSAATNAAMPTDAAGAPVSDADVKMLATLLNGN